MFLKDLKRDLHLLRASSDLALMQVEDVIGNSLIVLRGVDIPHNEDAVKPGEKGGLELDLLRYLLELIIPPVDGIGSRQDGRPRVETSRYACIGHTDDLLLHRLVDRHPVSRFHIVELVNADDPAVRKHQCSALDLKLTSWLSFDMLAFSPAAEEPLPEV